jgi:uracil-DNA glycosylase
MSKAGELSGLWAQHLGPQLEQPHMQQLKTFLKNEKAAGKIIFPPSADIFNAFAHTPLENVKVVILGQDPYHGPGQAHGLCFSVLPGIKVPPSLVNIFKEIESDIGVQMSGSGTLTPWADQGVLLLNATLTVEQANAGSHQKQGWEEFSDAAIRVVNEQCSGVVFLLWGSYAQKKATMINPQKHLVLTAPHPSPLSSYRGFFGCRHFSKANAYLMAQGKTPINWQL